MRKLALVLCAAIIAISFIDVRGASQLETAARALAPGSFVRFNVTNEVLLNANGASKNIVGFVSKLMWDPRRREIHTIGGDHNDCIYHVIYNENDNNITRSVPPWAASSPGCIGFGPTGHQFDQLAFSHTTGIMYRMRGGEDVFHVYDTRYNTWSISESDSASLNANPDDISIIYSPARRSILKISRAFTGNPPTAQVVELNEQIKVGGRFQILPTSTFSNVLNGGGPGYFPTMTIGLDGSGSALNMMAIYSDAVKSVFFGSGTCQGVTGPQADNCGTDEISGNPKVYRFFKIPESGVIQRLPDLPILYANQRTQASADPLTGDLFIFSGGGESSAGNRNKFWRYNVTTNTIALVGDGTTPFNNLSPMQVDNSTGAGSMTTYLASAVIPDYNVFFYWICRTDSGGTGQPLGGGPVGNNCSTWLYKPPAPATKTWAQKCSEPGVVRCVNFSNASELTGKIFNTEAPGNGGSNNGVMPAQDCTVRVPGTNNCSVNMKIKSNTGEGAGGYYVTDFKDDFTDQIDEGQEKVIQFRFRHSPGYLCGPGSGNPACTVPGHPGMGGGGWKMFIVSEGKQAAFPGSGLACTSLQVYANNGTYWGFPQFAHACPGEAALYPPLLSSGFGPSGDSQISLIDYPTFGQTGDGVNYQNARSSPGCLRSIVVPGGVPSGNYSTCFRFVGDKWITVQIRIRVGKWFRNNTEVGAGTVTVSGSTATFSVAQPNQTPGPDTSPHSVGDWVRYDSNTKTMFVTGRTSDTVFTVNTKRDGSGTNPPACTTCVVDLWSHPYSDGLIEIWMGNENEAMQPVLFYNFMDFINDPPSDSGLTSPKLGRIYLLTQNTGKVSSQTHPEENVWFGDLVVSNNWIQDPNVGTTAPPVPTLAVTKNGTGAGIVTSSPAGINCGGDCAETATASYVLTASASAGSVFIGWSGGGCAGTSTCSVNVTADTTVNAQFDTVANPVLTVVRAGAGTGGVTSSPAGINCGPTIEINDCTEAYAGSPTVTLTATPATTPAPGSFFQGWSGGGCSGTGTCVLTSFSVNTMVTATFGLNTPSPGHSKGGGSGNKRGGGGLLK